MAQEFKLDSMVVSGVSPQRGFTLIELVVVLTLLGIALLVAVPRYRDFQEQAGLGACQLDPKQFSQGPQAIGRVRHAV